MQTRRWSLIEAVASTALGAGASLLLQVFLAWAYDKSFTFGENVQWVVWFTLLSLVRGYGVRRLFNWVNNKLEAKE